MTKTALENKKLDTQKELQEKEQKWKSSENRKDRRKDYITKGMDVASRLLKVGRNDPAWYKRYLKDLDKFTNVPTYHRLGVPFRGESYASNAMGSTAQYAIPGIMTFKYNDFVGPQSSRIIDIPQNPVNQILMRSKEQVLKSNSRSSVTWEAADLGLNLFATASIITMMGEYKRLILCAQTYSSTNAYMGLGLLQAYGFTGEKASKFVGALAQHRKNYLLLAQRFNNAIVAPADLTLFKRKWYLATNIFADTTDPTRPQLYWFVDENAYKLSDDGSQLNAIGSFPLAFDAASDIYVFISNMINAIVENPDFQEMYADLRSAFGDNILKIDDTLDENAVLDINVDELNREQIRNLKTLPMFMYGDGTIVGSSIQAKQLAIVSDTTGYLYQGTKGTTLVREANSFFNAANTAGAAKNILEHEYSAKSHRSEIYNVAQLSKVNGDSILDITRFKFYGEITHNTSDQFVIINISDCGTEVITEGTMSSFVSNNNTLVKADTICTTVIWRPAETTAQNAQFELFRRIGCYTSFDWAPNIRMYAIPEDLVLTDYKPVLTIGDMVNSFTIAHSDLIDLHEACVLSELYLDTTSFKR